MPANSSVAACWSCSVQFAQVVESCPMCGAAVRFGSSPSLIAAFEDLLRTVDGKLAHLEASAKKHRAHRLEAKAYVARCALRVLRRMGDEMRDALRADGDERRAA